MAFILGVGRKNLGNHMADLKKILGFFIHPWGILNDLESVWKYFSSGKIRNLEKIITWDYSGVFEKFQYPVFWSKPEIKNTTLHNLKVNSIHPQCFI